MFNTTLEFRRPKGYTALLITAFTVVMPLTVHAADLTVIVNNVQQDAGQVMLGLFSSAESFPKTISQGALASAKERSATGQVRLVIKGLTPGQYAATAFHDLDSNGKLNANLMGLPTEPYGFSNNARGNFGPPAFKDAAISLGEQDLTIEVTLK
jgi:uncharacterized protein (DUF2141 family)